MVNLADLIDQLTASKAAGRPVKITNSRATGGEREVMLGTRLLCASVY